ncbi:YaaC family protein [Ferroacidibacillus organovorans]|uniref:Uncharacterized protein n=1 Tax=Ferroacidibacillus organovorans TaxID=1765683 RepID=A0A101XRH7_9BACL|nr:YaaC family protein [Ferroacidibacillus organovorans]KUO96173.1 hypothetical protein ATW55_00005 [Ferroacidibacillus organovorans]
MELNVPFEFPDLLSTLELPAGARVFLKDNERIKREERMDVSYRLSSLLRMGRTYFVQAERGTIALRPLLLYYGILNYTKAIVLLHHRTSKTTNSTQHGLSTARKKTTNQEYWRDRIYLKRRGAMLDWLMTFDSVNLKPLLKAEQDCAFKIDELWGCIPEVDDLQLIMNRSRRTSPYAIERKSKDSVFGTQFTLAADLPKRCQMTQEEIEILFIQNGRSDSCETCPSEVRFAQNESLVRNHELQQIEHPLRCRRTFKTLGIGNTVFIPPAIHHEIPFLPEPFIWTCLLFHASMIARYEAEEWVSLVGEDSSVETLMMKRLCTLVIREFPHYLIEQIIGSRQSETS